LRKAARVDCSENLAPAWRVASMRESALGARLLADPGRSTGLAIRFGLWETVGAWQRSARKPIKHSVRLMNWKLS